MDIKNHSLTLQKKARYNVYGTLTEETECFWFVLHGSRMLSEQMLYKFKEFDPKKHFVVAPEGLHRFYEKDFGGPVVASWMTKHYRLDDIEDNGNYLHSLIQPLYRTIAYDGQKSYSWFFSRGNDTLPLASSA